jgi:glycosyltransferase involved in cell wall biosynthesis
MATSAASAAPSDSPSDGPKAADARPLRVLTVTNMWPTGGDFRGIFVKEQVEALRRLGHDVDVEIVAQARGRRDYFLAAPRVRRRVRSGSYDVVHIHFGMTALAARLVGPVPRVLTLHGGDVHIWWQRWLTKLGWGGAAERIYASRRLARDGGEPTATVIACGLDTSLFAPMPQAQARARLGVGHDEPIVLFGAFPDNPVKGYDVFTDVLAALRERGVTAHEMVLAEPGQDRSRVAAKFAAADVLLVTSRKGTESGPVIVKEAALMGLPVVSVDVGDVAEVLASVTPSTVVEFPSPWGTPAAHAELVSRLADEVAAILVKRERSNGRERGTHLDGRVAAERVVEVYRRAVGSRPSR